MFRRKAFWVGLVFFLALGGLSLLAGKTSRTYANVTLVNFTARSLVGQPEIYINWETATELDTAGFYVQRSLTNQADAYARVSPFQPAQDGGVTGAVYDWIDEMTTLNTTYWYRLEEVTTAQVTVLYDSVSVIAGVAATPTPISAPPPVIYLPFILGEN